MQITVTEERWPKTWFEELEPREEGLHLSTVIKSLQEASGLGYKGKGFTDMQLTAEIGTLWERVFSKVMVEKYLGRIPQVQVDGIWMSLDGIGLDPLDEVPIVVEELKATWQSSNRSLTDNFYYMTQVMSYCHAIETTVCVMRVFYIMGDYKGSGPLYRVGRIVFSEQELDRNWAMVVRHKRVMEEGGEI